MRGLTVQLIALEKLRPDPNNARHHSKKQIREVARSIEQFGFNNPILIDGSHTVIAGHARLEAARLLGLRLVPTISLNHLSEAERRAYLIADNRLAELATWDIELLRGEITFLDNPEIDLDVTLTGFDTPEIDLLLGSSAPDITEEDDVELPNEDEPVVTCSGDLWCLGSHKLLCANALDPQGYDRLLGSGQIRMTFTDPPYNVPIAGHVRTASTDLHDEFAMASGEMNEEEFTQFLMQGLQLIARSSSDGALIFVCMDWRHMVEIASAASSTRLDLKNLCVWTKTNAGMGSLYRSQHELVFVFKHGHGPHINNVDLGRHGRHRSNVWTYPGVNTFRRGRDRDLAMHPTVKPVAMVADALLDCSNRHDLILDPFAGSGTTLVAAEKVDRSARCIELDPSYVDTAIRRWQGLTGHSAHLEPDGPSFDELAMMRSTATDNPAPVHCKPRRRRT